MRQRLGQHFLKSESALKKIAQACFGAGDVIVEIGPGHGELTKYLAAGGARVIALERDRALADGLKKNTACASVEIITGNALETFSAVVARLKKEKKSYVVAGNIPYYITGHLLRVIGDLEYKPARVVLLIQKEVAQRICASPPRMNLLAATIQIWSLPRVIFSVPRGSFAPPPEVDSAVVVLEAVPLPFSADLLPRYFSFVRALFKQPRKTILNNLVDGNVWAKSSAFPGSDFALGEQGRRRPHSLMANEVKDLFLLFSSR